MYSFYCQQNNGEKMCLLPIPCIIHNITIHIMLNLNGGYNGYGLKHYVWTDFEKV